jgi:hypothetical protein
MLIEPHPIPEQAIHGLAQKLLLNMPFRNYFQHLQTEAFELNPNLIELPPER